MKGGTFCHSVVEIPYFIVVRGLFLVMAFLLFVRIESFQFSQKFFDLVVVYLGNTRRINNQ